MNYTLVLKLIGNMLKAEAVFMLFPVAVSLLHGGGDAYAFIWAMVITASTGVLLSLLKPRIKKFNIKDASCAAALSWTALSLAGALPFYFSGHFASFVDCIFEAISGFTTTGASILPEIETLPHGILFWRSFSTWIGGMGVVVFMLAVMPSMNASSIHLLKAESTGPSTNKLSPKLSETAKTMYLIYLAMTAVLVILLVIAGMPVYDAFIHALSTAGTGGLSNMNDNIGAYGNISIEIIIAIFMFLFGVSFSLYYYLIYGHYKYLLADEEFRLYFAIVIVAIAAITFNIRGIYGSALTALRYSSFQVTSIISSTGFSTADFDIWPNFSRYLLLFLMFTGCCAGSTSGGVKLIRILLLFKMAGIELNKIIHPRRVKVLLINGKRADNDLVVKTSLFFFIYSAIFIISILLVSLDNKDMATTTTAVLSMLSNSGLGLGYIGRTANYSSFSPMSKIILSFCMLAGRLELLPVLILLKSAVPQIPTNSISHKSHDKGN